MPEHTPVNIPENATGREPESPLAIRARRHITRRLMPLLFVMYIIAYLDRVNVSFANLEMSKALKFTDDQFGLGAGLFFIGYFLLEIPGAIIVERWSARKWLARIMISWGIISAMLAFVRTPSQFYSVRLLLGAAEAGFFPGLIVYLTHWFRNQDRAKAVAMLMAAIPLSNVVGSPVSGLLLKLHWLGLAGWQWLFILEGIPAVVLGFATLFWLTDRPEEAHWLADDERAWIVDALAKEREVKRASHSLSLFQALAHRDVLILAGVYFLGVTANYGYQFWLPTLLKRASTLTNTEVTMVAAIPYFIGWICMMINGWHSDRSGERRFHVALPLTLASFALAAAAAVATSNNILLIVSVFCFVAAGINAYLPVFWALSTMTLSGTAGAAAVGLINSVGNLGGFAGPYIMGSLRTHTSSFAAGIGALSICVLGSVILALQVRHHRTAPPARTATPA